MALYILNTSCAPAVNGASEQASQGTSKAPLTLGAPAEAGGTDVLTNRYNNARTGANLTETQLHTGNVNSTQFGKLFTRSVVGQIYAQPLVVSNLTWSDGTVKNVVFVATMRNNLYAFDAENAANSAPLWQVSMGPSFPFTDYGNSTDITDHMGILATPVIDRSTNTMYLTATTKENNQYLYKLHALDLTTGQEKPNSPVIITGSIAGTTSDSANGVITFDPKMHLQRPGLLLTQGKIVLAFASHFDQQPYHGWVFSYDAQTLTQSAINIASRTSQGAGIWQSGAGLSTDDAGNIFGVTGNAFGADATDPTNRTESIVRWSLNGLTQQDWFTPANWKYLDDVDNDMGCDGAVLIPGTNLILTGAKSGTLFIMDRSNMGRLTPNDSGIHQEFQAVYNGGSLHIHGNPVFWEGPNGKAIYLWGESDFLRSFSFRSDGYFTPQVVSQSPMRAEPNSMPGGIVAISANGSQAGTGILWANLVLQGNANTGDRPGILRAFDASDITHELWNSEQNSARDHLGTFAKFNQPTIANGKVYMATFSNELVVYGVLPGAPVTAPIIAPPQPLALAPPSGDVVLVSKASNLCLSTGNGAAGTAFEIATCATVAAQNFQFTLAGTIQFGRTLCANAFGGNGNPGDAVGNWSCTAALNEKWNLLSNGEIRGINGLCLTTTGTSAGSQIAIEPCTGQSTQQWSTAPSGTVTPPPPPPPPPNDWTFCASENQFCTFTGPMLVRYGFGNTWVTQTLTGGTACNNATFGDPLFGTVKQCQIMPVPSQSFTFCAREDEFCTFTGTKTVRYGAGTTWVTKSLTGGTACTNGVFGDPLFGVRKTCEVSP